MARISLAIGTAHGPLLALEPELWVERAKTEMASPEAALNTLDGRFLTYAELLTEVGDRYSAKNNLETYTAQAEQGNAALDRLAAALAVSAPDAVVLIGNDQDELFDKSNIPALGIYHGREVRTHKRRTDGMPEWRKRVSRAYGMDEVRTYKGAPEIAEDLIRHLVADKFDVSAIGDVPAPEQRGFGHAYGFVAERLFGGEPPPLIPVLLNTFTPLNTPSPARCFAFGQALARAIEKLDPALEIAVIASGGLSHFICEEAFDRDILAKMTTGRAAELCSLPEPALKSGSSEIRSWIALGGLIGDRSCEWSDYIPVHRTPPGSGIGMAFGLWQ